MESKKHFEITPGPESTFVTATAELGMLLRHPGVRDIAAGYDSYVRSTVDFNQAEVIPPIPRGELEKFGQALVDLALSLDPSDPKPTYKVR
jgi:hypothetical protein